MNTTIFVGLDVHKATVSVAVAEGLRGGEVRCLGTFPNRPDQIAKLAQRLAREGRRLSFCYEAGPCGYGLYRQLTGLGHDCIVVAPSLIPVKAGDRVKTDRRDAAMLTGRTRQGKLVHFAGESDGPEPGALARVTVTSGHPHHLTGRLDEVVALPRHRRRIPVASG